jgi:hypothetical protein
MKSLIIAVLLLPTTAMAQVSGGPYGVPVPRIHSPRPAPLPQPAPLPEMPTVQWPQMQAPPVCQNVCNLYGCQLVCY